LPVNQLAVKSNLILSSQSRRRRDSTGKLDYIAVFYFFLQSKRVFYISSIQAFLDLGLVTLSITLSEALFQLVYDGI